MTTAAYQHILTAGLNIYVLELVVLYLGGSLALLFNGPGRFSFDAAMGPELISGIGGNDQSPGAGMASSSGTLIPVTIPVEAYNGAR
jgi:putative oxidoreductase